jgi:hypothetical protein
MHIRTLIARSRIVAMACALIFGAFGIASAGPGGGGGHGGGGGSFHGGGGGFHGGSRGGYYGGGAGRGGYYGWRGYYGGYGRWGRGGIGLGWYLPILPWGYETLWWGGVPYYYADNAYYLWDDSVGEYQAVEPPAGLTPSTPPTSPETTSELFAYPKGGQPDAQQRRDRTECQQWAASQTGFDPAKARIDATADTGARRRGYLRAEAACLEGRNYSVR